MRYLVICGTSNSIKPLGRQGRPSPFATLEVAPTTVIDSTASFKLKVVNILFSCCVENRSHITFNASTHKSRWERLEIFILTKEENVHWQDRPFQLTKWCQLKTPPVLASDSLHVHQLTVPDSMLQQAGKDLTMSLGIRQTGWGLRQDLKIKTPVKAVKAQTNPHQSINRMPRQTCPHWSGPIVFQYALANLKQPPLGSSLDATACKRVMIVNYMRQNSQMKIYGSIVEGIKHKSIPVS